MLLCLHRLLRNGSSICAIALSAEQYARCTSRGIARRRSTERGLPLLGSYACRRNNLRPTECTSSDLQPLQQKLLSGNVGLTPSGRAIPFTRAHTLYVSSLRICTVSSRLQSFVASNLHPHWQIRALEAGGGGDCLFHSVGATLEALLLLGLPGASDHVLQACRVKLM